MLSFHIENWYHARGSPLVSNTQRDPELYVTLHALGGRRFSMKCKWLTFKKISLIYLVLRCQP